VSAGERVFGLHAVRSLLERAPGRIRQLWVLDSRQDDKLRELVGLAETARIPIAVRSRRELDELGGQGNHQGVLAEVEAQPVLTEAALPDFLAGLAEPAFLLILDGVQDPHNLGACLRSADAAGVHAVIVPRDKSVGLTPVVRKVACGAAETVPLVAVTNLARTLRGLRDSGIWLYGAAGEATESLYQTRLTGPLGLILGGEGKGLRRLTREHCDGLFAIPMAGSVESLNVSVATGIALFEARRQRLQPSI
jgi:23S rRNA (guanosine2251-2'-O)-methyltransferase